MRILSRPAARRRWSAREQNSALASQDLGDLSAATLMAVKLLAASVAAAERMGDPRQPHEPRSREISRLATHRRTHPKIGRARYSDSAGC